MRVKRTTILLLLTGLALLAAACSGDDDTSIDGVASVSDLDETLEDAEEVAASVAAAEDADADADVSAEEIALDFSVCMRENGYPEFPDPVIDENGNPNLRSAIFQSGIDFAAPEFREQTEACRDEVGADQLGAGGRGGDVREQIQERLLDYTQCLRDEGLDVGDLTPGGPGQGQQGQGQQGQGQQGQGDGQGQPRGGAATLEDRAERVAGALGLDSDDPDTAAALEACDDVLVEAFAGLGG